MSPTCHPDPTWEIDLWRFTKLSVAPFVLLSQPGEEDSVVRQFAWGRSRPPAEAPTSDVARAGRTAPSGRAPGAGPLVASPTSRAWSFTPLRTLEPEAGQDGGHSATSATPGSSEASTRCAPRESARGAPQPTVRDRGSAPFEAPHRSTGATSSGPGPRSTGSGSRAEARHRTSSASTHRSGAISRRAPKDHSGDFRRRGTCRGCRLRDTGTRAGSGPAERPAQPLRRRARARSRSARPAERRRGYFEDRER